MKQWIRWSGLLGFVAVVAVLALFFFLAAGPLAKMAIESVGSKMADAKVEVDSVSFTVNPIGFELQDLTVANSDKPMENLLQFATAKAELELAPLLLGKAIIREMSVDGLEFDTPRTTSGALEKKKKTAKESASEQTSAEESKSSPLDMVELPSAQEILAREQLKTESAGEAFQQSYKQNKAAIDDAVAAVPDSRALAQYEDELKKITSGKLKSLDDFKQRKKQLDDLKKRFKADKEAVAAARKVIADAKDDIREKLVALKNAPGEDIDNIKDKYQINATGAANLSGLLFGSEAAEWAQKALFWYEKIQPYLAAEEEKKAQEQEPEQIRDGRFVHFPSADPWPEFLLRDAHITAQVPLGKLLISAEDITDQQKVLGRPANIVINGAELHDVQDLTADLVLDHRGKVGNDTLTVTAKDWHLKGMKLGIGGTELESAMAQLQGLAVVSDGRLDARTDVQFGQADFGGKGNTTFAKELRHALAGIKEFEVHAKASGKLKSPKVELGSDLDTRLKSAFNQRLNEKQQELEQKLQARLQEKLQNYTGDYADQLAELNKMDGSLADKMNNLNKMASSDLEDYEAQKKREAEEKAAKKRDEAKDKVKDKLKSLF